MQIAAPSATSLFATVFASRNNPRTENDASHEHGGAGHKRRESSDFPPQRQIRHHQRRMRVGGSGVRNQASAQQQIARGRYVVAGFVPEIRQAQQGGVQRQ